MPHQKQSTASRSRVLVPKLEELLNSPFTRRKLEKELKICESARQIISFCSYRRAADHYCYVRPAAQHAVRGARRGQSSVIVVDLAHPMRWYEKVYRKGLAQVEGLFILDLLEELEDGRLVLLACWQGRGCSLDIRPVFARPGGRGWQLNWKTLHGKPNPHKHALTSTQTDDYYRLAMMHLASRSINTVLKGSLNPDT